MATWFLYYLRGVPNLSSHSFPSRLFLTQISKHLIAMRFIFLAALTTGIAAHDISKNRQGLYKRSDYPSPGMVTIQCPGSNSPDNSCAKVDSSWPSHDMTCGQGKIQLTLLQRAADAITRQIHTSREAVKTPSNIPDQCKNIKQIYSYTHGNTNFLYGLDTTCNCASGVSPKCNSNKSSEACNTTQLVFCGASMDRNACTA